MGVVRRMTNSISSLFFVSSHLHLHLRMDETKEPHFPFDVWVGHIIPFLRARDVLALACVSHTFYGYVRALPRHCISTGCVYHALNLESCLKLVEFQTKHPFLRMAINVSAWNATKLFDFSHFSAMHTLSIHWFSCDFDFRPLSSLQTLRLYKCGITDVSALGTVHTLTLDRCQGITDVGALGSVHTITIDHCQNITDVSSLSTVHTFTRYLWSA